jgi:hypothetical protein
VKLRFLRALLPSWRFFDRAAPSPRLFVRIDDGEWSAFDAGPRPALAPLFAPSANLHLAYSSAIERLVQELGDLEIDGDVPTDGIERDPRVTELVSYQLVCRISATVVPPGTSYQWKIVASGEDYIVGAWRSIG